MTTSGLQRRHENSIFSVEPKFVSWLLITIVQFDFDIVRLFWLNSFYAFPLFITYSVAAFVDTHELRQTSCVHSVLLEHVVDE